MEVSRVPPSEERLAQIAREQKLEALLALDLPAVEAAVSKTAAVEKALVDKGVVTAKDITDAATAIAVEAPVEEPLQP